MRAPDCQKCLPLSPGCLNQRLAESFRFVPYLGIVEPACGMASSNRRCATPVHGHYKPAEGGRTVKQLWLAADPATSSIGWDPDPCVGSPSTLLTCHSSDSRTATA